MYRLYIRLYLYLYLDERGYTYTYFFYYVRYNRIVNFTLDLRLTHLSAPSTQSIRLQFPMLAQRIGGGYFG